MVDYSSSSSGDASNSGNAVSVDGGGNKYVVSYDYASESGGGGMGGGSGANPFGSTYGGAEAGGGSFGGGGGGSSFPGMGGSGGGAPAGGAPAGGAPSSGAPAGGAPAGGAPAGGQGGGMMSGGGSAEGGDSGSFLRQTPFGRLAEIEGGEEAFIQAIATRSAADEAAGVANPFGEVAPGTNPFSDLGQPGGGSSMNQDIA